MNNNFTVPAININSAIGILYPYCYSIEYMNSINWLQENAEDEFMFDVSMAITLLGGQLPDKSMYNDLN